MQGQKDIPEIIELLFQKVNELEREIKVLKLENRTLRSKLADYQTPVKI